MPALWSLTFHSASIYRYTSPYGRRPRGLSVGKNTPHSAVIVLRFVLHIPERSVAVLDPIVLNYTGSPTVAGQRVRRRRHDVVCRHWQRCRRVSWRTVAKSERGRHGSAKAEL